MFREKGSESIFPANFLGETSGEKQIENYLIGRKTLLTGEYISLEYIIAKRVPGAP